MVSPYRILDERCHLCGERPAVDHDHEPHPRWPLRGPVRGLLCRQCNTTLGGVEAVGVERIAAYLGASPIGPDYADAVHRRRPRRPRSRSGKPSTQGSGRARTLATVETLWEWFEFGLARGWCPCGCPFDFTLHVHWADDDGEVYDHTSGEVTTFLDNLWIHFAAGWRHDGRNPFGARDGQGVYDDAVRARWAALGLYRNP